MTAEAVIETVKNAGGDITVSGDRIRYRLPKDLPDKDRVLAELREHKSEIILLLSGRPQTCAPSCYEVEPGCWIHRPWDGCKTCLAPLPEKLPEKADVACWHCAGTAECDCITCGHLESHAEWKAGPCVPCKVHKEAQVQK